VPDAGAVVQPTVSAGSLHIAVHDVAGARVAQVGNFPLPGSAFGTPEWRLAVHAAADEVERSITGLRGIAATRILFVQGNRLYVVDSDGANLRAVSEGSRVLSPAWHPGGAEVAYSTLGGSGWSIIMRPVDGGGRARTLSTGGGLNVTPAFSPDGRTLVYSHADEQGSDLVAMSMDGGGSTRRVTVGRGSENVSPSFSPDGRRIAFTSSRSGHPEVYITDVDGTNAELLTPFLAGDRSYRSNPDWSPDGRTIAFQSQLDGRFQVMTINLRDRSIKQHTTEGMNEDPSWAPDGRHLVFTSTRTGTKQLHVLDTESGRVRQLTRGGGGPRLAAWSPPLVAVR
jgi:TolB protein